MIRHRIIAIYVTTLLFILEPGLSYLTYKSVLPKSKMRNEYHSNKQCLHLYLHKIHMQTLLIARTHVNSLKS